MLKFNNTHIFTSYLKQKLGSINIPACKIYTREFAEYLAKHGQEDPRVIESIDTIVYNKTDKRLATRINYLKNNELYHYFWNYVDYDTAEDLGHSNASWRHSANVFYDSDKNTPGLTKTLYSPGRHYDVTTHDYLGEYLRFLRDYHNINLMSLYNCFNNNICNNIKYIDYITFEYTNGAGEPQQKQKRIAFDSQDPRYKIYAFPVKLFNNYTIAIDSYQGIEMFCGLYNTALDVSDKATDLIKKTYKKINSTIFSQPFLYDMLDVENWNYRKELQKVTVHNSQTNIDETKVRIDNNIISRWDIANREQDLKLFIKVPVSCKSSIVVLEGDFRAFNDFIYVPPGEYNPDGTLFEQTEENTEPFRVQSMWEFKQNHSIINFGDNTDIKNGLDTNKSPFTPLSRLQLLAVNTGESYPFADRLVEYLSGSAITPIDEIPDNVKRAQKVMRQNQHYFQIEGLWENKMQKIIYDYIINSGPIQVDNNGKLIDKRQGYHRGLGYSNKSALFDVLGYVDKDAEKWYASWRKQDDKEVVQDNIQNVDIYDGLYDI